MKKIAATYTSNLLLNKAKTLASKLNLPLIDQKESGPFSYLLTITENHLELRENTPKKNTPLYVDFLSPKLNYRVKHASKKNELIAKAIGIKGSKHPFILDATAGFGVDAFILASLGCKVLMLEKSPIIGALLEDGLERLSKSLNNNKELNLNLKITDSFKYIENIIKNNLEKPDVIYLDPMYPKRTKSALNKKSMRILHDIVGFEDASKLLNTALKCTKKRVVVKRPIYAKHLGDIKPDLKLSSERSSRYDIYLGSGPDIIQ